MDRKSLPDVSGLGLKTVVNGEVRIDSNTSRMIFDIPRQIAYISQLCTLEPGDLIATGVALGRQAPTKRCWKWATSSRAPWKELARSATPSPRRRPPIPRRGPDTSGPASRLVSHHLLGKLGRHVEGKVYPSEVWALPDGQETN